MTLSFALHRLNCLYLVVVATTAVVEGSAEQGTNFVSFGRLDVPSLWGDRRSRRSSVDNWMVSSAAASMEMSTATIPIESVVEDGPTDGGLFSQLFSRLPLPFSSPPSTPTATLIETTAADDEKSLEERLTAITQPIIPADTWESLTGTEFQQHPERLGALTEMGAFLATNDESNEWIEWKEFGAHDSLEKGHIHVWTGKARCEGYGTQVPFIKTRSIVPMAVQEMVELLLDSDRVQTYNPWSMGRKDCWIAAESNGLTKIVKNRTQPPLGSKPMVSTTLLHAAPWRDNRWLVVSRAIGGNLFSDAEDADAGRSDILLGVNMLQPVSDESCLLTAVTHVYSSAVPTMLAERLGVKSAIKFVKDMRQLKKVAAN